MTVQTTTPVLFFQKQKTAYRALVVKAKNTAYRALVEKAKPKVMRLTKYH
jgi:hypothetical protein